MRIVQLNLAWGRPLIDADSVLDSYHTLTGWSDALAATGAAVHVVQRFANDAHRSRAGVTYDFVKDDGPPRLSAWSAPARIVQRVVDAAPDVVHVNGLMFPGMVSALRRALPRSSVIVLQDHSGVLPRRVPWPLGARVRARWTRAFGAADACAFTARELAERWHDFGFPHEMPLLEIPEASTALEPMHRADAAITTGMRGAPQILWVGRLDRNKDPDTVLDGFEVALRRLDGAKLIMVVPSHVSRTDTRLRIDSSETLRDRVTLVGAVPHSEMAPYYAAADIFISGSHHEGSGYALIEAMACGAAPCVTDIPAFRALTGGCGALWPVGDAQGCAQAILHLAAEDLPAARDEARRRFVSALSWPVIGRAMRQAYDGLIETRRAS